jgi:ATP-dependent DNA helicase DinG
VVLSDPRIVTKGYGRELLEGLPPARRLASPWPQALAAVAAFYRARTARDGVGAPPGA